MAFRLAMGKFAHLSERKDRDEGDDEDDYEPLPRKGLGNVPPHLSVRFYRMSKTSIEKLLEKIGPNLMPKGTGGHPIDPASKVLASLKILATGSFQGAVADSMNYSQVGILLRADQGWVQSGSRGGTRESRTQP